MKKDKEKYVPHEVEVLAMRYSWHCPACDKWVETGKLDRGFNVKCPKCGAEFNAIPLVAI